MGLQTIPARIPADAGDVGTRALSPVIHLNLGCRLAFDGRLDADALARAVRLVLDAEPVLGCSLRRMRSGVAWERCADLDASVPFRLVVTGDADHNSVVFHGEGFEKDAPRLAVRLLRSPYGDDLCLKVDHLVADGRGATEIAYLLAETYTRVLADPSYRPRPNLEARPTYDDLWAALTPEQRDAAELSPRFAPNRWKITLYPGPASGMRVGTLTVFPCGLAAVKAYGKARSATVNDMLAAALLRSLARMSPPAPGVPLGLSITADLRRFAPQARFERACNLSSAQTVEIMDDATGTFDDTLRHVVESLRPWKDGLWAFASLRRPGLPAPVMRALMSAVIAYAGRHALVPPTVMNIGVLDESRLTFGGTRPVTAHMLGPVLKAPGFAAVVSTYLDELTVWMGFYEELTAPELVERVLRGMDEELRARVWRPRTPDSAEGIDARCEASKVRV